MVPNFNQPSSPTSWAGTLQRLAVWGCLPAAVICGGLALTSIQEVSGRDKVVVKIVSDVRAVAQADGKGKPAAGTGTLRGTVVFEGAIPSLPPLHAKGANVKDAAICSAAAVPDESLVVDSKTKGVQNVFVYLLKAPAGAEVPPVPKEPVVFDQKGCHFIPHAMLVRTGQTVLVKSGDAIAHNTHTNPLRSAGFNQIIKPDDRAGVPLVYDKPERMPIEVKCDLHAWMRAYHLALDHPFMAVTDATGKFEIKGLPPGKHKFTVWQERVGYLERAYEVDIKAGKPTEVKLPFGASKFKLADAGPARTVTVPSLP